jgi:hypothetical protein
MLQWYWFRVRYASGHVDNVATLDTSLSAAWARQWGSARARALHWQRTPKRGWRTPPHITRIDVVREPIDLARTDSVFKKYLDDTLKLVNTRD